MSSLNRDENGKPIPPRKDWPFTAHPNGQWSKKCQGQVYYFGAWDEWREAEKSYGRRWPSISTGQGDPDAIAAEALKADGSLEEVVNAFLLIKQEHRDTFRISVKHYAGMRRELTYLLDFQPKGDSSAWRKRKPASIKPAEWAKLHANLEDNYGPDGRKRMIGLYRSLAKFAAENGLGKFDFASALPLPAKAEIRAARRDRDREHGEKLFPREQIKPILDACDMPVDAMYLLALNAGFTAADCGELAEDDLDLDNSTFMYDRVKTGVQRAGVLWPETVKALREAISHRPKINADEYNAARAAWTKAKPEGKEAVRRWQAREPRWDRLVFITRFGRPWMRQEKTLTDGKENVTAFDGVALEFGKVLKRLDEKHPDGLGGMDFKRGRINFGTGRHTYFSAAKRIDEEAAKFIMGHADESMGAWYDHLDDAKWERLGDVANGIYGLLMTQAKPTAKGFRFRPLRLAGAAPGNTAASA